MRAVSVLTLLLLAVSCQQRESKAMPPKTRDRVAELRDPLSPFPTAHANPRPSPETLGCYSVSLTPDLRRLARVPATIRLTANPRKEFLLHQRYSVESGGFAPGVWSWQPYTEAEVHVFIGDGFSGWIFKLHRTPDGMEGSGEWMDDTMQRRSAAVRLAKIAC